MFAKLTAVTILFIVVQITSSTAITKETQEEVVKNIENAVQVHVAATKEINTNFEFFYDDLRSILTNINIFFEDQIENNKKESLNLTKILTEEAEQANVDISQCLEGLEPLDQLGKEMIERINQCYYMTDTSMVSVKYIFQVALSQEDDRIYSMWYVLSKCTEQDCLDELNKRAINVVENGRMNIIYIAKVPMYIMDRFRVDNGYCFLNKEEEYMSTTSKMLQDVSKCARDIIG